MKVFLFLRYKIQIYNLTKTIKTKKSQIKIIPNRIQQNKVLSLFNFLKIIFKYLKSNKKIKTPFLNPKFNMMSNMVNMLLIKELRDCFMEVYLGRSRWNTIKRIYKK